MHGYFRCFHDQERMNVKPTLQPIQQHLHINAVWRTTKSECPCRHCREVVHQNETQKYRAFKDLKCQESSAHANNGTSRLKEKLWKHFWVILLPSFGVVLGVLLKKWGAVRVCTLLPKRFPSAFLCESAFMNWGLCCTDHTRQEQEVSQRIELFKVADLTGMFHRRFCKQSFYGFRSEPVGRKSGHEINILKMCPVPYNNSVLMCTWTASLFSKYTIQYTYIIYHYHIVTRV